MARSKSPFLDNALLRQEIDHYLARFRSTFAQEIEKTSAFFEIACYNDLVRYYENMGFEPRPQNTAPRTRQFIYALSPNAKPANCSYFLLERKYRSTIVAFEIRHNLRVRSAHDDGVFISPDFTVIKPGMLESIRSKEYYNGKVDYDFVRAERLQTFADAKHYAPSPELILNFVGIVNELFPDLMTGALHSAVPKHLGPSLFISGSGNLHHQRIRASLARRYGINVFLGLFSNRTQAYSTRNQRNLVKIGTR